MPYPQISTEKGRLYQYLHILGGPNPADGELSLLVLWSRKTATFEELVQDFNSSGYGSYQLRLDDRLPQEDRVVSPGYLVFGRPEGVSTVNEERLVGVFIPRGTEGEVSRCFKEQVGKVLIVPTTPNNFFMLRRTPIR